MKKLALFIGLTVLSFGAFAEKVPSIIVNKQQGGFSALFNLYNYVNYTPAELTANGVAQLDCSGNGFTACRVPNCGCMPVNDGNIVVNVTDAAKVNAFLTAANNVIAQYESALEQNAGTSAKPDESKTAAPVPSVYTKTISLAGNSAKAKNETYVVRGVVTSQTSNASTMKIYIEKVDILSSLGSH